MTLKLLRIQYFRGFPDGSVVKNPPAIQEPGRSPGERNAKPLQYSCLESPMDRGAWWAAVHWVAKEADTSATEQQCFQIRHLSPYPILQKIQGQLYLCFFSSSTAATLAKCSKPVYSLQLLTSSDIWYNKTPTCPSQKSWQLDLWM